MPVSFLKSVARRAKLGSREPSQVGYRNRLDVIKELNLEGKTGVEIGVYKGDFSHSLLSKQKVARLYMIDPWKNFDDPGLKRSWYHKSSKTDMQVVYTQVKKRFTEQERAGQVKILRGSSDQVISAIADGELDFAYLDGDHRYEGVQTDLVMVADKVKQDGCIILDDHRLGKWWKDSVVRAVNEFLGANSRSWMITHAGARQVVIRKISTAD